ncbi:MAG: hypothetical protein SynsKO_01290 [Synoicihabitans sp.]
MSFTYQPRYLASALLLALGATLGPNVAAEIATAGTGEESDFLPAIQMSPFVVEGDSSAIFVHARSRGDRRYAEKFAEAVVQVNYDAIGKSTGRGLVIVGRNKEPHPLFIFQKFIAMADAGQLHPSVIPFATKARERIAEWEQEVDVEDADMEIEFEMVVELLPLPLKGAGSKLYQWAWVDEFDMEVVEERFRNLRAQDFAEDQLASYDWVFYLPPKSAVHRVIKEIIPLVMKAEDMGFFARAAVRGALIAFRPVITKAMEGMRKGMLFYAVTDARTDYSEDDIKQLTEAYVEVLMPDFKFNGGSEHQRAVEALQRQMQENYEYSLDPLIVPERLAEFDSAAYSRFVGDYFDNGESEVTHRFRMEGSDFTWTYREQDAMIFHPVSSHQLVRADDKMTIEFLVNDAGEITGVEERWHRKRKTVPAQPVTMHAEN